MAAIMEEKPLPTGNGILTEHPEGVHVVPATTRLARVEVELVTEIGGQTILRQYIDKVRGQYDYIIIDCQPSLGMLTLNTLTAADKLIIPVQAQYLAMKGLEQLLHTVAKVKKSINPKLKIAEILLTMVDARTNYARETMDLLDETYGGRINIIDTRIPQAVKLSEITTMGRSIFAYAPGSKAAVAYEDLTKEVIALENRSKRH
jgi:chromosome partitioning protein